MRQQGVTVASRRRHDNVASGWRQVDVKRRGARIKLAMTTYPSRHCARVQRLCARSLGYLVLILPDSPC